MLVEGMHEKGIFTEGFPFRLAINTMDNFEYPLHWHAAIELLFIEENSFNISVNNQQLVLEEGDILFIAKGDTHGFSNQNNKGRRIFIQFDTTTFNTFESNNIVKSLLSSTFKTSSKNDPFYQQLKENIESIINAYSQKSFGFELFLSARIYDILAIIASFSAEKINLQNCSDNVKKINRLEKLSDSFKFIESNYMNDISLSDVAKAVGFSDFYFSRIFKEITEKNFNYYLNEYRIKQAEYFLMNSIMSVADIAYTVGFNSIVTFNRAFKSIKGCSPSTYKKIGL